MRDERIWKKDKSGEWQPQDAVFKHENGEAEERERVAQAPESERTLSKENRRMYYNSANPPEMTGEPALDQPSAAFKVL